jgi:hypothetical protein
MTPTSVRTFGWMRSATHVSMMARSGNMQIAPMAPVKVRCGGSPPGEWRPDEALVRADPAGRTARSVLAGAGIIEGSGTSR